MQEDEAAPDPGGHTGLKGLIVPVLTPFDDVGGIDRHAFIMHLEFLARHDITRIMVNGTTAEFYSLLPDERRTLLKLARRHFPGQVILHAGGLGLAQNLNEVRWANEYGADAVAALPPIYPAGLSEAGIVDYFCALEAEAGVPFLLYNFPRHSGNPVTPDILRQVGSSTKIYEPVQQGASGFVSATANVRPEIYAAMETLAVSMKVEEAAILQEEIRAYSAPFSAGGVPMLKAALARKLPQYPLNVRLPLVR